MGPTDAQKYAAQHGNGLVPGAQISVPSGLGSGFSNFNFPQKTITPVPAGKTWTPYIDTSNVNPQGPLLSKPSVPNMPVPIGGAPAVDTSAIAPAAPAGPDWMALLKMLQGPAGPNYGALLAGLGTPGKIADLNTPDLHYIYNDFSQPISKAWENLASQIQGFGTAAVGREQAAQDALAQGFGQTRKDVMDAQDKATNDMQALADRLMISDAGLVPQKQERLDKANRLAGISDIMNQAYLGSAKNLATARQANYDTFGMMAQGSKASSLSDLASQVANQQGQAELATQDYYAKAKLAEAQGRLDLAHTYANAADQAQSRQMDMFKTWASLKSEYDKTQAAAAASANPALSAEQLTTQNNSGMWDALQGLQGPASKYAQDALFNATGNPDEAIKALYVKSQQPPPVKLPTLPGLGGITNLYNSFVTKQNAQQIPAPDLAALNQAIAALRPYAPGFGGSSTKSTVTSKGKSGVPA